MKPSISLFISVATAWISLGSPALAQDDYCSSRYKNNSPLTLAVCRADLALVKKLVKNENADVNAPDADGFRPLDVAFNSGTVYWQPVTPAMAPVIEYLLDKGANPNVPFKNGGLPLASAAYTGNMRLVPRIVSAGADLNAPHGDRGITALHCAAVCDFRLSTDDARIYPAPTTSEVAFYRTWQAGAKPVIEYLVAHGADIHVKTNDGKSVLDFVPTPCSFAPELCKADKLASAVWPTGSCKQTYLYVKNLLEAGY